MSYYDNIKDNVKKQAASNSSGSSKSSSAGGNFDTLKEAASETEPDEEKGDDTPIEVLEEDGLSRNPKRNNDKNKTNSSQKRNSSSSGSSGNPFKDGEDEENSVNSGNTDLSVVEDKLDTIIDQNQKLIEILQSFAE